MRRSVAVLLTLCLTASTVEALVGGVQHAEIHGAARASSPAAVGGAPRAGAPAESAPAAVAAGGHGADVVLVAHSHHDDGDPSPPAGDHCAHFHTVGPVGAVTAPLPLSLVEPRGPGQRTLRPAHPALAPPTQPPRA